MDDCLLQESGRRNVLTITIIHVNYEYQILFIYLHVFEYIRRFL